MTRADPPPLRIGVMRTLLRLGVIAVLAVGLHYVFSWGEGWIRQSEYGWAMPGLMIAAIVIYALLIAIPFVPAVEIGLSVLAAGGPAMAPFVWLATASGLTLAYMAGCAVPLAWLHRFFRDMHLVRVAQTIAEFEALTPQERAAYLYGLLPRRYCGWIVKYRYPTLAVLINLPGNSVIGGGGGIALISGLSGVFRPALTLVTIGIATAPVPFAVWLFDWQISWG
ncbi:hypothetical protein [Roseovarius sp. D22-M7]|uniref:hypothetical protein n=1 Tax=Roseovarius sp. D22-M7 TaxID=3127116 RepID=UPI0030102DA2